MSSKEISLELTVWHHSCPQPMVTAGRQRGAKYDHRFTSTRSPHETATGNSSPGDLVVHPFDRRASMEVRYRTSTAEQGRPDSMETPREHKGFPVRPASRAQRRNSVPRGTPVRAGRAVPGPRDSNPSTRNALLWAVIIGAVLVWMFRDLVLLVGYSVLLAYALLPVVGAIERPRGRRGPHLPRGVSAAAVMLGLVAVVSW